MFQSDFGIIADYFVKRRKGYKTIENHKPIKHVDEMLKFMRIFAEDERFLQLDVKKNEEGMRENMSEEKKCSNCMEQKLRQEVREILEQYTTSKDNLIQILNEIQEKYGYIPKEAQLEISDYLKIPMAEIYGVITFYSRFTLKPKGKYNVSVCLGTACFVKGSQAILDRLKSRLNIQEGETTKDGKFSIDATRCVGACGLAPVFTVNDEVYGKATVKKLDEVLDEYMKKD